MANVLKSSLIYGKCAVLDYNFNEYSSISNDTFYKTISSPIYSTISSIVYYSISSSIYTSISDTIGTTISDTIYINDASGNLVPQVSYYDYSSTNYSYANDGYIWNNYQKIIYTEAITGYISTDLYYKNKFEKSALYVEGNTKLMGNLQLGGMVQTMNDYAYALSVSGNIIVQPTYKIQCDSIVAGESKNLYIGCDDNTENIFIGSNCNIYLDSSYNYITKNNLIVTDSCITLNKGGVTNIGCGIEIETNNLISDYIKTNGTKWVIKSNSGSEYDIVTSNDLINYPTNSSITTINDKITNASGNIYTKYIQCAGITNLHNTSLVQGAYLSWNTTNGIGETNFINVKGGGAGGFYFYNCGSTVNSGSLIVQINSLGDITCNKLNVVSSELNFNSTTSIINLNTAKNNYIQCINNTTVFWSNNNWLFRTLDGTSYPLILTQTGYLGIGSINPTEMLTLFNGNIYLYGTGLKVYFSTGKTNYISSDNTNLSIRSDGQINFKNSANTVTKMIIDAIGNVGINITPSEKLHVNGNAIITGTITSSNISSLETKTTKIGNTSFSTTFTHDIQVTGNITALNYFQTYFWRGILDSTNNVYPTIALVLSCFRQSIGYYKFTININDGNEFYHVSVDVIKNNTPTLANQLIYFVTNKTQYYFYITLMTPAGVLCDVERANGGYISVVVTPIK